MERCELEQLHKPMWSELYLLDRYGSTGYGRYKYVHYQGNGKLGLDRLM